MPEGFPAERFARGLLHQGLPAGYVKLALRELAEHWADLKQEALEAGQGEPEAEAWATREIGDVDTLAACFAATMKRSTWIGRHPWIVFCLLPFVAVIAWWALFLYPTCWASGLFQWSENKSLPEPNWVFLQQLLWCIKAGAAIALPWLFCWVAGRCFCRFKWAVIAVALLSLHSGLHFARFTPPGSTGHANFAMGYVVRRDLRGLDLPGFGLPLLTLAAFRWQQLKQRNKLTKPGI